MLTDIVLLSVAFAAGSLGIAGLVHAGATVHTLIATAKADAQAMDAYFANFESILPSVPAVAPAAVAPTKP